MSNTWGKNLHLTIFGESHGAGVGMVLEGLPAGLCLDEAFLAAQLKRRRAGRPGTTQRKETDEFRWLGGVRDGYTIGTPVCAFFPNQDVRSADYAFDFWRPSHADYTNEIKYHGQGDSRGGGQASGRMTAPLVLAGALCALALWEHYDIQAASHIERLGSYTEPRFSMQPERDCLAALAASELPCLLPEGPEAVRRVIAEAQEAQDSVGGLAETILVGIPAGWGDPFFQSVESRLAQLLFSVPGVKGVSFGAGFSLAEMKGSPAHECFVWKDGRVQTRTNHSGGLQGGITNGMPLVFETVMKPTPSIGKSQKTLGRDGTEVERTIRGRHDACILLRAIPALEACAWLALYDAWKGRNEHA